MSRTLADVQNRIVSLWQAAYRESPVPAALASISFVGLERFGAAITHTRKRRISLLSVVAMAFIAGPAAAQSCGSGPLGFLQSIYDLVTMGAGTIILTMVILAGVLKMIPMRGTNSWGNALIGGVATGLVFLVLGPALVDIASQSIPGMDLSSQCGTGGNSTA